jgi:hypothetical protein
MDQALGRLTAVPVDLKREELTAYAALYLVFLLWGIRLIAYDPIGGDIGHSFLHNINLPFHEFGHVLFRPFGEWLTFLGGSLFQCLLPVILGGVFLVRERNPFPATLCLWWAGENLLDLAPYIGDARAMDLPLVGEWSEEVAELRILRHDWHNLLEPMGMLAWDHRLAVLAHVAGALLMVLAWIWGGWWLWQARKQLRSG